MNGLSVIVENLLSKKFGVMLAVGYVLYQKSLAHPEHDMIYTGTMVVLAIAYCAMDIIVGKKSGATTGGTSNGTTTTTITNPVPEDKK